MKRRGVDTSCCWAIYYNGRIKKITSFQTLDYYVFNHKHFGEKVGDNDCQEKHKNCTKTKAIAAKTIIVMSTTESEGNYQTITYKENYLFPDVTIQTWLARLLTFFTQQRTLLTVLGLGLRKIMQFERSESLNFLISLTTKVLVAPSFPKSAPQSV